MMKFEKLNYSTSYEVGNEEGFGIDIHIFHNGNIKLWNYLKKKIRLALKEWEEHHGDTDVEW